MLGIQAVDVFNERKVPALPTPKCGGLAVAVGIASMLPRGISGYIGVVLLFFSALIPFTLYIRMGGSDKGDPKNLTSTISESEELTRILTSIIRTSQENCRQFSG